MASITDILMAQGRLEAQNRLRSGQLIGNLVGAVGEMPGQFLQQRAAEQLRQAQQRRAEQELAIKQAKERREEERAAATTGIAINKETREQDEADRKAMTEDATRLLASGRGDTANTLRYLERYQHRLDPSLLEELKQGAYTAPDAVLSQFGTPPKAPERPKPVGPLTQFTVPNTPEPLPVQRLDNGTMVDVRTGQPVQLPATARVYEKPAAEPVLSLQEQANRALKSGDTATYKRLLQVQREFGEAGRAPERATTADTTSDVKDFVDGVINGTIPPETRGLFRNTLPVKAEMARRGYDLTKATQDWNAMSAYMRTLNGAQQTRVRQATEFVNETVPLVRDISAELSNVMPRGQYPLLNKAALTAAMQGVMGKDAQAAATRLNSQISDLQSELAVMFRGGNAATNEALKKAADMLKSEWSQPQLEAALKLIEQNAKLRLNSIRNVGVGTFGGADNQYAPTPLATSKKIGRFDVEVEP